jgi:hypothetical protein
MAEFLEGLVRGMGWGAAASLLAIFVAVAPSVLH